jgi:hypothetical protein
MQKGNPKTLYKVCLDLIEQLEDHKKHKDARQRLLEQQ